MSQAIEFRPCTEADVPLLEPCYRAAFPEAAPRGAAEWRWRLFENPAGTRAFVAVEEGDVVGLFGGLPRRTWCDGRSFVFTEGIDGMVHPRARTGLKRPGLFVRLGEAFFEAYGERESDALFYGWPTAANRRVGERFLDYERVATQLVLTRGVAGASATAPNASPVEALTELGVEVRWLYERIVDRWGAGAVRDESSLTWRYLERPGVPYLVLGARFGDVLGGLAIARLVDLGAGPQLAIAEWLVESEEAEDRLLAELDVRAAQVGARGLLILVPDWAPEFTRLQRRGFRAVATPWDLVVRTFRRRFDHAFLREHWWCTLGDSDLV